MPDTPRKLRIIDSPDPERPPAGPEPTREKLRLGAKEFTDVNRAQEATTTPITVQEILATNLAKTVPAERPLDLRPRRSRRTRDYWLCLVFGNAIFASPLLFTRNPFALAAGIGGCVVFSIGLTWIMWQVMSDY